MPSGAPAGAQSLAQLKCKAKNEIGLQQRACLFQVVQAPAPKLSHTCSLASVQANSLQVGCKINEHLKTDELEMSSTITTTTQVAPGGSRTGLSGWLSLEAIQRQQQQRQLEPNSYQEPHQRLVYPPSWLLVELYRATSSPASSNSNSIQADEGELNYELVAYTVVSSAEQLAPIKSLVEENKLFKWQPRDVYYVIARQPVGAAPNSSTGAASDPLPAPLPFHLQRSSSHHLDERPGSASIQLAEAFNFTVPSLEASRRYKLLIYGQNLANKTRDWLVLRAETPPEQQIQAHSQLRLDDSLAATATGGGRQSEPRDEEQRPRSALEGPFQQKSIVMRSEEELEASSSTVRDQTGQQQVQAGGRHLSPGFSRLLDKQLEQIALYKDQALLYARQRPLLAIPAALASFLLLAVLLVWLAGLLLGRRRRPEPVGERRSSICKGSSSASSSASSTSSSSAAAATGLNSAADERKQQSGSNGFATSASPNDSFGSSSGREDQTNSMSPSNLLLADSTLGLLADPNRTGSRATICRLHQHQGPEQQVPRVLSAIALEQVAEQPRGCHLGPSQRLLGSLDRRLMQDQVQQQQQQQKRHEHCGHLLDGTGQIYALSEHSAACQSIDRRSAGGLLSYRKQQLAEQQHYQPLLLADLGGPPQVIEAGAGPGPEELLANELCYGNILQGSFSSTECSSLQLDQQLQLARAGRNRSQRVAFDLGENQRKRHHFVPIQVLLEAGGHQHHQAAGFELEPATKMAASDSGNSANTADSGHESPLTNGTELTGGACANHQQLALRAQQPEPHPARPRLCQRHLPLTDNQQEIGGGGGQGKVLMLMEMSPGSQEESSTTLLQSVDSFNSEQLHQNHQLATSFVSASALARNSNGKKQQVAQEVANADHWL